MEKAQPSAEFIEKSQTQTKKGNVYKCPSCSKNLYKQNPNYDTDGETEDSQGEVDRYISCCKCERRTVKYFICNECEYDVCARCVKKEKKPGFPIIYTGKLIGTNWGSNSNRVTIFNAYMIKQWVEALETLNSDEMDELNTALDEIYEGCGEMMT